MMIPAVVPRFFAGVCVLGRRARFWREVTHVWFLAVRRMALCGHGMHGLRLRLMWCGEGLRCLLGIFFLRVGGRVCGHVCDGPAGGCSALLV